MAAKESVLYYSPEKNEKTRKVKSVLVRCGIRIRNITSEQFGEQVGTLAGRAEFPGKLRPDAQEEAGTADGGRPDAGKEADGGGGDSAPALFPGEFLVLCNFTDAGMDRLLRELRRAGTPVELKAVLTETNCAWSFEKLYREVCREHDALMEKEKN